MELIKTPSSRPPKTIPGPSILFENKLFLHHLPPVAEHIARVRGLSASAEAVQGRAGPGPLPLQ